MIRALLGVAAAGLLAACMTEAPAEPAAPYDAEAERQCAAQGGTYRKDAGGRWSCLEQAAGPIESEADCRSAGGRWARGGILGAMVCYTATPDAGQACTTSSDCTGFCMAATRTCSEITPMFGCFEILEQGEVVGLCVD